MKVKVVLDWRVGVYYRVVACARLSNSGTQTEKCEAQKKRRKIQSEDAGHPLINGIQGARCFGKGLQNRILTFRVTHSGFGPVPLVSLPLCLTETS